MILLYDLRTKINIYTLCSYCLLVAQPNNDQGNLAFIVNIQHSPILPMYYTPNLTPRGNAEPILVRVGEMLNTESTDYKEN